MSSFGNHCWKMLIFTSHLMSYRSCVEGLYLAFFRMPPALAELHERRRRIIQTLVWFGLSLIVAVFVKDIEYAVALIGGLAALFIFFYPGW